MALNTWWDGDPDQRYWMEITQRDVLGENLLAPKLDGAGREQWSYTLVSLVEPGDRVLHYRTNEPGGAAIVGWSEATDSASTGTITWQARGTRGRARGQATTGPSWFVPLGGLHELDAPVQGRDLAPVEAELLRLRADLETAHGTPVYFPFFQYRPGEIRAQQGYLVKFPAELFSLLPELGAVTGDDREAAPDDTGEVSEDESPPGKRAARGRTTRVQDPVLRSAIENHAVDAAIEHYRLLGGTDFEKRGKPYDVKLTLDGQERHVEVKGSSLTIETVELTINEVIHAGDFQPTDLVVVDGIDWSRTGDVVTAAGGRLRIWRDWAPLDEDLDARKFAYYLPAED